MKLFKVFILSVSLVSVLLSCKSVGYIDDVGKTNDDLEKSVSVSVFFGDSLNDCSIIGKDNNRNAIYVLDNSIFEKVYNKNNVSVAKHSKVVNDIIINAIFDTYSPDDVQDLLN